jgi:hypothetical protein
MNVIALPYSPPVENPCTSRARSSSIGASTPIRSSLGMQPIAKVPTAISTIVVASTVLRPMRSASGPKNIPPNGRTRNATANSPKVATVPAVSPRSAKNTFLIVGSKYA